MSAQPIEPEPAPEARPAVTLSVAALAVFETIAELRVVSVVLEHARPDEKMTVERIHELLGGERKTETSVKRGLRTALANGTLVAVPLSKGGRVRTYVAGPKIVDLVWAQSVPESDKPSSGTECAQMVDMGTTRARTLSDSGTKCAQKTGTESAQNAVPSTATVVDTRAHAISPQASSVSLRVCVEGGAGGNTHTAGSEVSERVALVRAITRACYGVERTPVTAILKADMAADDCERDGVTAADVDAMVADWRLPDPPTPRQIAESVLRHKAKLAHKAAKAPVRPPAWQPPDESEVYDYIDLERERKLGLVQQGGAA